jgi:hypothetical protein
MKTTVKRLAGGLARVTVANGRKYLVSDVSQHVGRPCWEIREEIEVDGRPEICDPCGEAKSRALAVKMIGNWWV